MEKYGKVLVAADRNRYQARAPARVHARDPSQLDRSGLAHDLGIEHAQIEQAPGGGTGGHEPVRVPGAVGHDVEGPDPL